MYSTIKAYVPVVVVVFICLIRRRFEKNVCGHFLRSVLFTIIGSHPIEWRHFCVLRNNSSYIEKLILLSLSYFFAHRNIWGRQKLPFTSGLQVNSPKVK